MPKNGRANQSGSIQLPSSEAFVVEVEAILNLLHISMPTSKPSKEDIQQFSTFFGSYLGETWRRNRGGEWGIANQTPALRFGGDYTSYPWARVYKRLMNREEDNVHHWYLGMIRLRPLSSFY